jgi:sugar lactone lactonase YvrE
MRRTRARPLVCALVALAPVLAADGLAAQVPRAGPDSCTRAPLPPGTSPLPRPSGIALDRYDTLYISSYADSSVSVYAPGATGYATPVRTLGGRGAGWPAALGVAVGARGEVYVANAPAPPASYGAVTVYAPGAAGNAPPIRTILGTDSTLQYPRGIAVDARGAVYVMSSGAGPVFAYPPGASGHAVPSRRIGDRPRTDLSWTELSGFAPSRPRRRTRPEDAKAIAIGADGSVLVAATGVLVDSGAIAVYDSAGGDAGAPARLVTGAATGLRRPGGLGVGHDGSIYVTNNTPFVDTVTVYAAAAEGDARPIRRIAGSATGLSAPSAVTLDRRGFLYVVDGSAITVYTPEADGNAAPVRTIAGAHTGLFSPQGIAVDRHGYIYVASDTAGPARERIGRVLVYAPGASGDAAPARTISGRATRLNYVVGLALDGADNLYVLNGQVPTEDFGSVAVFAPGASGAARPVRMIAGHDTRLNEPGAIALDPHGTLYVANGGAFTHTIVAFSRRANGETPPLRVLQAPQSGYERPQALAFDTAGRLYVASAAGSGGIDAYGPDLGAIVVHGRRAVGAVEPLRAIRGYHTRLNGPHALALDHDTLYVANLWDNRAGSVTVYVPGAAGDAAPVRMLRGPATELCAPVGVAVDRHGALYVANATTSTVTVYPRGATGNAAPMRTLGGLMGFR